MAKHDPIGALAFSMLFVNVMIASTLTLKVLVALTTREDYTGLPPRQ
jgi:hypothetical protein